MARFISLSALFVIVALPISAQESPPRKTAVSIVGNMDIVFGEIDR